MQKIKVTKRERKSLRGINEAMRNSAKNGKMMVIAGTKYIGRLPVFRDLNANNPTLTPHWVKVSNGVPFVRASA